MKKVLVIGCARSGYWVSRLLNEHGYDVTVTDQKAIPEKAELEKMGITVIEHGHPDYLLAIDWDFAVKNPGISYKVPFVAALVEKNIRIYTEIEIALPYAEHFRYGAVTGTNGKTTTTTLLALILEAERTAYASGNIGTPLSETVYHHGQETADIAIEISAFQLVGAPSFHPLVSAIVNLTPDHLDYFASLDDYYQAKTLVYRNQRDDDWFLRNTDDLNVLKYCRDIPCKIIDFSLDHDADLMLKKGWVTLFDTELFAVSDLKIVGRHNIQNAMIAAAMAYRLGINPSTIRRVISEFRGIEHRIEFVQEIGSVKYFNDSKGTNVDSTVTALKAFDQPVILIAGGYDKHTGFKDMENYRDKIKKLLVYGATKKELAQLKADAIICEDLQEATQKAYELALPNDIVLFSPACASYDQFNNYEERGRLFKDIVRHLGL
ncbi:MAG: UDP-N-acetylmuramoyl-L-alanine--D-glutamate ligase [Erysipelotrichaceae bacterium]|nr:UDP-N-acetylmuramoyl-L-alanine--D-glutamate ligase [Erysipelotrichaceae bacterium]